MSMRRGSSTASVVLGSLACLLLVNLDTTAAKRGCTAFGHSCFGGHGKRSDVEAGLSGGPGPFSPFGELPARFGALPPLPLPRDQLPPGSGSPPDSDMPAYSSRTLIGRPVINLSPLLKQWLQTYRRSSDADSEKK